MAPRAPLLESMLTPARLRETRREQDAFVAFTRRLHIEQSSEALILYLTFLEGQQLTGKLLLRKLSALDLARRIAGQPPWRASPDIHQYLRGLHQERPIGVSAERLDPIYPGTLRAMVDAVLLPHSDQLRDRAVILLANTAPWPAWALAQLRWRHLRFHRDYVELTLPPQRRPLHRRQEHISIGARGDDLCVVAALRQLRPANSSPDGFVFASRFGASPRGAVEHLVALLPRQHGPQYPIRLRTGGRPLRRILDAVTAPWPLQLRDRAILLIGFGAALTGHQAMELKQSQVATCPAGLVLDLPHRHGPTGIPAHPQTEYCALAAWQAWVGALAAQGLRGPTKPAFVAGNFRVLWDLPLAKDRLTAVVIDAADAARLKGRYTFNSLRIGFVRSALRSGEPAHVVAAHAGYRHVATVLRHERREQIIGTNVAGELGL